MDELLRFKSVSANGKNVIFPPKIEFIFYEDRVELYKRKKLVRTINYEDISEISLIKTWQNNVFINCVPTGVNIYKISDELFHKIKEITKK